MQRLLSGPLWDTAGRPRCWPLDHHRVPDVPSLDPADAALCAACGRRWTDVDGGRGWLHLEVTRNDGADGADYLDVDFCSQQHAAEWLQRPLPEPVLETSFVMTPRDRLVGAGVGLVLGLAAALAMLGIWTVARLIIAPL